MIELHTWFRRTGVDKGIQTHQKNTQIVQEMKHPYEKRSRFHSHQLPACHNVHQLKSQHFIVTCVTRRILHFKTNQIHNGLQI